MTIDWASFIFGVVSAIAVSSLIVVGIVVALAIRSFRYKAPPLFQDRS